MACGVVLLKLHVCNINAFQFRHEKVSNHVSVRFFVVGLVSIKLWTNEERAFAMEVFFSFGRSVIATQRAFRKQFNIAPAGRVSDRKSICLWVDTFRDTGSMMKKHDGPSRTIRTPENTESTVTVNSEPYISMIEEFFLPKLEEMDAGDVWFQQDGATTYTARTSMNLLPEHFPERLISLRGQRDRQI